MISTPREILMTKYRGSNNKRHRQRERERETKRKRQRERERESERERERELWELRHDVCLLWNWTHYSRFHGPPIWDVLSARSLAPISQGFGNTILLPQPPPPCHHPLLLAFVASLSWKVKIIRAATSTNGISYGSTFANSACDCLVVGWECGGEVVKAEGWIRLLFLISVFLPLPVSFSDREPGESSKPHVKWSHPQPVRGGITRIVEPGGLSNAAVRDKWRALWTDGVSLPLKCHSPWDTAVLQPLWALTVWATLSAVSSQGRRDGQCTVCSLTELIYREHCSEHHVNTKQPLADTMSSARRATYKNIKATKPGKNTWITN